MKSFCCTAFISILAIAPFAAAHGFVSKVVIQGKAYNGNVPNNAKFDSPIRLIDDISPVKGASNKNLVCGQNAANAALVADANPGDTVDFFWLAGGGVNWPHNTGPIMTYMASCGSTTCDKFDATNAKWFKTDEQGKKSDNTTWIQADLMQGKSVSTTIPKDLAAGGYLIRHEIIALHLATSMGGAEFYPSCTQLNVGGSQTGKPTNTVSFPGAYTDSEPGIFDPNVFNPGSKYVFPGPPIDALAASGTSSSNSSSTAPAPSSSASASASAGASTASPGGKGHCMPRRYSRIMRNIMH